MIPLTGFAPDANQATPGVLTDCTNLIPTESGFRGAPSAQSAGAAALAAECVGAAGVTDLSGNRKVYAGTAAKLYELSGTSWTDRSRAGDYTLGAERWSFVQYGNSTLAANQTCVVQKATSGAFADISGSPQAKIIEASQGFALAFNTTTSADEWYCSAYLDETDWSLDVATQCVKGRLVGGSGPINAAMRFGDDVVAYKSGSMFIGRYVGAPEVWRWTQVSNDVGCIGQSAVVDTSVGHIFMSRDNLYLFDGTQPKPLATGVCRDWLLGDMAGSYAFKTQLLWDRNSNLVWVFYARGGGSGAVDRCLVYHIPSRRFGLAHQTIEAVLTYSSPTLTYGASDGDAGINSYDDAPAIPFDSPFWISGGQTPAVFTSSHVLSTLSGQCSAADFTTGDYGDDEGYRLCRNLRVRYETAPTTSTATGYTKDTSGVSVASIASGTQSDGRHPMRQMARWHRFKVAQTGDFEVSAIRPEFVEAGRR